MIRAKNIRVPSLGKKWNCANVYIFELNSLIKYTEFRGNSLIVLQSNRSQFCMQTISASEQILGVKLDEMCADFRIV